MRIEIENSKLEQIMQFMYNLRLVRKQSRFRRRFINLLQDKLKTYEEDRVELLKEHANKDEKGEAIIHGGRYDIADMVAFSNDLAELKSERLVIEGGDNREMIRTLQSVLRELENEFYEGTDSETYDYLCDQFQIDNEGGEEQ